MAAVQETCKHLVNLLLILIFLVLIHGFHQDLVLMLMCLLSRDPTLIEGHLFQYLSFVRLFLYTLVLL